MTEADLTPEPSMVDAILIALVLHGAWAKILADKDVPPEKRLDYLASAIPLAQDSLSALRMVAAEHLIAFSAPSAVRARAQAAKAAQARAVERSGRMAKALERRQHERALRDAVTKAQSEQRDAQGVLGRLEASGSDDVRGQVLARGALAAAEARLGEARKALAAAGLREDPHA